MRSEQDDIGCLEKASRCRGECGTFRDLLDKSGKIVVSSSVGMPDLKLGGPFSNHLVLQMDQENAIWGWDLPGQRVEIRIEGNKRPPEVAADISDSDGNWTVRLPKLPAGGPYRLRICGSSELVLADVLSGEVWLASGQSNMEWKVANVDAAESEIAAARFNSIRMLKVPAHAAPAAEEAFDAEWTVCSPESVADMSAVGYFFARAIHRALSVPVGIIDATWGGTLIEAWTSLEALRPVVPDLPEDMANLARESTQIDRIRDEYQQRVKAWERDSLPADPGNLGMLDGWALEGFDDSQWNEMDLPRYWQSEGMQFNGVVWFRRAIELPKSWGGRDLWLSLGAIDDFDQTYFNGVLIGEHPDGTPDAYRIRREYHIPGALVHPGRNVIAVRVFDHCGNGGFAGPRSALTISKSEGSTKILSLSGMWKYAVELEIPLVPMQVFQTFPPPPRVIAEQHAPAALFHGMIAPLLPYGLRGMLWYQGESNTEQYRSYRERLVALIRDWRTRFGQGTLPFLLVQLAGFRGTTAWPYLREAQALACQEPRVFMATAVDVGDANDIHPRNKQAVGERLSLIALREVYGKPVACYGPELERLTIEGGRIRVSYRHASGLHTSDGNPQVRGFELAGLNGEFHSALAMIDGEQVVVEASRVEHPVLLRYAWQDCPDVNLVNAAGLPALPVRSDGAGPK